ncbi:MAG: TRAP transporter small permease subunit [Gammaproteobacteria bacterium]|nr:TRAP transporter small permease subunit [Gammaproteobacteria bacterium]
MKKLGQLCQKISELTGKLVSWLSLLIVLTTFTIVILRYFFNTGSIAMQESTSYMYSLLFLIGIAYTLKHDEHVRVDIFYQNFSGKIKAVIEILGTLILLLPMVIFIFYISWDYVIQSWQMMEDSPDAGGLPYVYLLKSSLLVFCVLLIIEAIAKILLNTDKLINPGKQE